MTKIKHCKTLLSIVLLFSTASSTVAAELPGEQIFKQKCTLCHAIDKKKLGPAVNKMSSDAEILRGIISRGQGVMPAYETKLASAEIDALVEYLLANQ